MGFMKDLTGKKFGKWTVVKLTGKTPARKLLWLCRCDCGTEKIVLAGNLMRGLSSSCGMCPRNTFIFCSDYVIGETAKGEQFCFDKEYFDLISQFTWHKDTQGYFGANHKDTIIKLHRLIMGFPENILIDHINGDSSNNRRNNLRICTNQQNVMNKKKPSLGKTSIYKGVSWHRRVKKWHAAICLNQKDIHLGYFNYEVDAAKAYNHAAVKYFGEFARLNEIAV